MPDELNKLHELSEFFDSIYLHTQSNLKFMTPKQRYINLAILAHLSLVLNSLGALQEGIPDEHLEMWAKMEAAI